MGEAEERVRALHVPVRLAADGYPIPDEEPEARVVCEGCSMFDQSDGQQVGKSADWPCDTIIALDEAKMERDVLMELVKRLREALIPFSRMFDTWRSLAVKEAELRIYARNAREGNNMVDTVHMGGVLC